MTEDSEKNSNQNQSRQIENDIEQRMLKHFDHIDQNWF